MDFNSLLPDERTVLQEALMKGYMLLTSGQYDEASLDEALNELSEALKKTRRSIQ